jgi:hypothetical protein
MLTVGRKRWLRILLALLGAWTLWLLKIEITYQHNVRNMPAVFHYRRHVITRMSRA